MKIKCLLQILLVVSILFWNACQEKTSSAAFVTVSHNGEITLFGEKTPIENLQRLLLDSLKKMPALPNRIDIEYDGEVLMGMRGEVETEVSAALEAAKSNRDTATGGSSTQDDPDLVAINDVIHGFYAWYIEFQIDESKNISFTRPKDNHLSLDIPKLEQYLSNIKASGFISEELINNEIAALKQCEQLWKNESLDEPPSCLDYDRFFCAQDWDMAFWTQAPIGAEGLGTNQVTATMSAGEGDSLQEQKFDLRKENGKWMITKIYCE